jgi:hypothetical protein
MFSITTSSDNVRLFSSFTVLLIIVDDHISLRSQFVALKVNVKDDKLSAYFENTHFTLLRDAKRVYSRFILKSFSPSPSEILAFRVDNSDHLWLIALNTKAL